MSPRPITENTLFYGDNLIILREHIPSESVDLIYLDPPFNSSRNYNVLFKDEHGTESEAQITAFEVKCQVPEKLNIKVRVNKGQLAAHDLWHSDQATVDLTLRVAGLDYKN